MHSSSRLYIYFVLFVKCNHSINAFPDGRKEPVHFDKITSRITKLCYGLDMDYVDPVSHGSTHVD